MIDLKVIEKKAVLQHDSSDCGVACLVSVINCLGGSSSFENIRKLSGTGPTGTTLLGLYQAANQCGFDATGYDAGIEDIINYNGILILHVSLSENLEHYIVCFGYDKGKFYIWDPAEGLKVMTPDQLSGIWKSRKCLGLIKNKNFTLNKNLRSGIREWLYNILKPDLSLFTASIFLGIVYSALGLVLAILTQKLLDQILPRKDIKLLIISLLAVLILFIARIVFGFLRQLLLINQGREFNVRLIDGFFGSILHLPKSFFDTRKTGDFVARLNDTMRIQRVITEVIVIYTIDILIVFASLIYLFFLSNTIGLMTLVFFPVLFFIVHHRRKIIMESQQNVMGKYALSESYYIDSLKGIAEIKSLGWQTHFRKINKAVYSDFQEKMFFLGKIKIRLGLLTGVAGSLYILSVVFCASIGVIKSQLTTGELMAIITISSGAVPSMLNLALISIPLNEAKVALLRMFEFTQTPSELNENDQPEKNVELRSILLKEVSFRFPGRKLLLNNINLKIEKGKIISLVGESGGGKTTLANIIMRFYEPESGTILVNGDHEAGLIPLNKWREQIGYIPQEIHVFNGTILQNLIIELSEEKVKDLFIKIREMGFEEFFNSFPSGIMTVVGEEGLNLSGGQKQIIGFVRALASPRQFLIIDEGTSNMDIETEKSIIRFLRKLRSEVGILLITHKVNVVAELSDLIYVVDNGVISGVGDHEALQKTNSMYKKFWGNLIIL